MSPPVQAFARVARRALRRVSEERAFTMIEVVMASTIFLIVATGIAGVLTSSITSHSSSRERTRAEQIAQAQLEKIRTVTFDNLHNGSASVPAAGFSGTVPAGYGVSIDVTPVIDGTVTKQNPNDLDYRKITVVVTRTRDGKELARLQTLVSPPDRFGGARSVAVSVNVKDWGYPLGSTNSSVTGATVFLENGPSPDDSAVTGSSGIATFFSLDPTDPSPPKNYYDLTVTKSGYVTYPPDLPPATAAHVQLAPSETASTTIRIFKPASLNVALKNGASPYTGAATIKVLSQKTGNWTTFTTSGDPSGVLAISSIAGDYVYPNVLYSVYAYTPTGLCSSTVQQNVPDDYPNTMDTTFNMPLTTCPSGDLTVNVKQLGVDVNGASVTLTGGPNDVNITSAPPSPNGTDASGNITFTNVPTGTFPYTITASKVVGGVTYTGTGTTTVASGTNNASVTLGSPSMATVNVTVTLAGSPVSGATVSLDNSPFGVSFTNQTTNGSGVATFTSVPIGTGYTVNASKSGVTGSNGSLTVSGTTTSTSIALAAGSLTVNATQSSAAATNASITVSGGPFGITQTVTAASGSTTSTGLAAGTGYTVTASRYGQTVTVSSVTITGSATTTVNATIPTPPAGSVTVNVTWGGSNVNGASVRLQNASLGYDQTLTTPAGGSVTFTGVPAGTGYSAAATALGVTQTNAAVTVTSSSTTTVPLALPTGSVTVTVKKDGANVSGAVVVLAQTTLGYSQSLTTTATGTVTFTSVPATSGFTATATSGGFSDSDSPLTVPSGSTLTVPLTLPGTLTVNVKRSGTNQNNATVVISGGPNGIAAVTAFTNSSGNAVFNNVPVGGGYTIKAYATSCGAVSSPRGVTSTNQTMNATATTINVSYNSGTCPQ